MVLRGAVRRLLTGTVLALTLAASLPRPARAEPDPVGAHTGSAADVPAARPGQPTLGEVADALGKTRVSLNFVWMLLGGFLVMFMQAGFALVETGLTRAKNVAHTMAMNLFVYAIGILCFWAVGFGLQMGGAGALGTLGGNAGLGRELSLHLFGKSFGVAGGSGFLLTGASYDVAIFATFLFQMVFMDTAATIPTGALAERWRFSAFCLFSAAVCAVIYPLYANWTWGGGWLSQLGVSFGLGHGHVDFAGSSVVHMVGGVMALTGVIWLGARKGRFRKDGRPVPIPGHNVPMAVLGTIILAFGWFGFNGGSTLAGTDLRLAIVLVNTMLASAAGAMSATLWVWWRLGKPDVTLMCNGLLGGLVAVTAPCAYVNAPSAVLIGLAAGLVTTWVNLAVERRFKLDDPVGAIGVHGACGALGVLAVGLLADGTYGIGQNGVAGGVRGLLYGDPGQLAASVIGLLALLAWVVPTSLAAFWAVEKLVGNRVSEEVEVAGLDLAEIGLEGYPDPSAIGASSVEHGAAFGQRSPAPAAKRAAAEEPL
ncbi:MAG: ammonium transporter [Myxococcales bacterium]